MDRGKVGEANFAKGIGDGSGNGEARVEAIARGTKGDPRLKKRRGRHGQRGGTKGINEAGVLETLDDSGGN